MLKISHGIIQRAQKCVLYGPEGIGKTTLASEAPEPLFIDTEGGTSHLDVNRLTECPQTWEELLKTIEEVAKEDCCKTLVIDTIDWAEQIAINHILKKYNQPSIESFGYGKGYTYIAEEAGRFLSALDKVIASGKNVILTAHAKMRKQELPDEAGQFDRWELKLSKQVAPLIKEWADAVLFINYKTLLVKTDSGNNKARGGKRVIYTTHNPTWDAKNRHGLENELPLEYSAIAHIFADSTPAKANPKKTADIQTEVKEEPKTEDKGEALDDDAVLFDKGDKLAEQMEKDGITEEAIRGILNKSKNYDPDKPLSDYADKLVAQWGVILNKLSVF